AVLVIERDGIETEVDARPSDAVALGMRCGAPLYVTEKVMNSSGVLLEAKEGPVKEPPAKDNAARGTILEQLKAKMEKAVKEERYEDAAKLRDQIAHIEQAHGKN
ncbi:MAG: bifunctional nuclease domain-containing protein, partial [bacterium]